VRSPADPRGIQPLVDLLHEQADRRGDGDDGTDAGRRDRQHADAVASLATLLEEDLELVRPGTRATLEAFVLGPVSSLDDGAVLGPRATLLVTGYGESGAPSSVTHVRLLETLAVAVVRDAWDMAAEVGEVLIRSGSTASELAAVVGLDLWETEAALAGHDPGDDYFARRAELSDDERRRWIASLASAGADHAT
jgi:hypothetical protein